MADGLGYEVDASLGVFIPDSQAYKVKFVPNFTLKDYIAVCKLLALDYFHICLANLDGFMHMRIYPSSGYSGCLLWQVITTRPQPNICL
jgi:hypothetical protein